MDINGPRNSSTSRSDARQTRAGVFDAPESLDVPSDQQLVPKEIDYQNAPIAARKGSLQHRIAGLTLLGIGLIAGVLLVIHSNTSKQQSTLDASADQSARIKSQTIPLSDLGLQPLGKLSQISSNQLTINGQVDITNSLVLEPTAKPQGAVAGQLYFDQQRHQLGYYDSKGFVYLQGGSGAVTNNITNVYNSYASYSTTVTSGTTGITSINGTAGSIAMFTGTGSLTESLITQSGSSLSTGTGVENVTIGSTSGASKTVVQGGTGNVLINTADASGTGGTITIQSGASSTTAAGDVTIDTGAGIINGTVIGSRDFEDGTLDDMVDCFGYDSALANTAAQAHTGSHSMSVTMGNSGQYCVGQQTPYQIGAQAGHSYRFSAWVKAGSTSRTFTFETEFSSTGYSGGGSLGLEQWGTVTDSSGTWKQVSGTLVAPASTITLGVAFFSGSGVPNGEVHYIDDITVTDLNSALAVSQLNLGATNAQQVTIGNLNQIGATTIDGSGIDINGNLGVTNISSGFINITGNGASNFTTGSGSALTLTSGASASWGVANALYGGSLTLHAGSSGGNNDGGNIVIQSGSGAGTGVSGDITIDTQSSPVSGEVVDSRGFESGTDDMLSWYGNTVAQTNVAVHSGSFSLAETGTGGNWGVIQDEGPAPAPIVAGHQYFFSAYVRAISTSRTIGSYITWKGVGGSATLTSVTDSSAGWSQITGTVTAPVGATGAFWQFTGTGSAGEIHLFDDLTVTDLSAATDTSDINLGTTNAQTVNIGNLSEVGATSIFGGGINLGAGAGTINLNAGSVIVKPQANSTVTFEVQDSAGSTTVLGVDTTNKIVTVTSLAINVDLTLAGHVITSGSAPTFASGTAADCSGTGTVSVAGDDTSGTVTITTGTGPCSSGGTLATITFNSAYASAPRVILTPAEANGATLQYYSGTSATTNFTIDTNNAPAAGTTYKYAYWVVQ
jgi:hypothetical protein